MTDHIDAARRMLGFGPSRPMTDAETRIARARTALILDFPWFGSLALRLRSEEVRGMGTMGTDGTRLMYDPDAIAAWGDDELMGVIAHEVMHCALLHMYRCSGRDMRDWNMACDLAINPLLLGAGLRLPDGMLLDPQYNGMSAEAIYSKVRAGRKPGDGDDGDGDGTGGPLPGGTKQPDFTRPPAATPPPPTPPGPTAPQDGDGGSESGPSQGGESDSDWDGGDEGIRGTGGNGGGTRGGTRADSDTGDMTESDWAIAAEQASMMDKKRGGGISGGEIDRAVRGTRESAEDCYAALRRFCDSVMPADYSWAVPNRRFIGGGLYLPGMRTENTARFGVIVDTSGSIDSGMLRRFGGYLGDLLGEVRPVAFDVLYCDDRVRGDVETFTPDEHAGDVALSLSGRGGGGTRFGPGLDWFSAAGGDTALDRERVRAIIYLTDPYPLERLIGTSVL